MPTTPSPAQSEASRQNGARSAGPATPAGKARSSLERRPPRPVWADILPPARRGPGRVPQARGDVARRLVAARSPRARGGRMRHPRHVARDPCRPAGGAGADRSLRRRRDRRRRREGSRQVRRLSRRWPRCCATAAGSSASTGPPCRPSKPCASAAAPCRGRDRANPTRSRPRPPSSHPRPSLSASRPRPLLPPARPSTRRATERTRTRPPEPPPAPRPRGHEPPRRLTPRSRAIRQALPEPPHAIGVERTLVRDQGQVARNRLGDQQAVERVAERAGAMPWREPPPRSSAMRPSRRRHQSATCGRCGRWP